MTRPREPLLHYVRHAVSVYTGDRALRAVLLANAVAAASAGGVAPILLAYAKRWAGLGENGIALYIAVLPVLTIPLALCCGRLTTRLGPSRVTAGLALMAAAGIAITTQLSGRHLVPAMMVSSAATFIYSDDLIAVMNCAPPGESHTYIAIMYSITLLPGLFPLALSKVVEARPGPVLWMLIALLGLAAVLFLRAARIVDNEGGGRASDVWDDDRGEV